MKALPIHTLEKMRKALCLAIVLAMAFALFVPGNVFDPGNQQGKAFAEGEASDGSAGEGDSEGGDTGGGDTGSGDVGGGTGGNSGSEGGGDTGGTGGGSEGGGEQPPAVDGICGIGIYYLNTATCVGETTYPNRRLTTISEKGGVVELYAVCDWDDWSTTTNDYRLQWRSTDESVFTVYGGRVQAVGNGTAQLVAYVDASDNPNGGYVEAQATIEVVGQDDARYVTSIKIGDENGEPINGPFEITGDIATEMYGFTAIVEVFDPEKQSTTKYVSQFGSLSSQVPGLGDIHWYVGDPAMSAVDDDTMPGMWRPAAYGISSLYAYTNAGIGNSEVRASITIAMRDPDGGLQDDEYHPQSSITVLAYYEMYPPEDMRNPDDKSFVINKKFSLAELSAMGTVAQTYTAFGSGTYYTMSGMGVPLSTVLSEAGVNLNGVKTIAFGTADLIDRPVSYSYIFDTSRYYFPNIDMMSFAEAQQVYPILAFTSNLSKNASTDPDYGTMTEATRFRLLFGSTTDGGTSQYQVKWIHTLYITLAGGPAMEEGDGNGGGGGEGGGGTGTGGESGAGAGSGDEGSQAGDATSGAGLAEAGAATKSDDQARNVEQNATGGTEAESGDAGGSVGDKTGTVSEAGKVNLSPESQQFTVYQVMNPNDSDVDTPLSPNNPYKPYAAPAGAAALVFGGAYAFLWYRRETESLVPAASGDAKATA